MPASDNNLKSVYEQVAVNYLRLLTRLVINEDVLTGVSSFG
jgi:hypothetical protein